MRLVKRKTPDCVEYDQPDELTAKVRREILREWTAHVEGMVRRTSDRDAACYVPDEEFRAGIEVSSMSPMPAIRARSSRPLTGAFSVDGRSPLGSSPTSSTHTAMSPLASSNHGMMDSVARTRRAHSRPPCVGGDGLRSR